MPARFDEQWALNLLRRMNWKGKRLFGADLMEFQLEIDSNALYRRNQQRMQDAFFSAWRTMPPRDPLDCSYFPSELRTFPIFIETLEELSLEEIVKHYARSPIVIATVD